MDGVVTLLQCGIPYLGVIGTLAGVYLTHKLWAQREKDREKDFRSFELLQRKIDEFYGPMLSMCAELQLRRKVFHDIRNDVAELYGKHKASKHFRTAERYSQEYQFLTMKEVERYRKVEIPMLKEMVMLFRYKGWLAENSTQSQLSSLMGLLEVLELKAENRSLLDLLAGVRTTEEVFKLLEDDLKLNHDKLLNTLGERPTLLDYQIRAVPTYVPKALTTVSSTTESESKENRVGAVANAG
jgi:hypothetical protein